MNYQIIPAKIFNEETQNPNMRFTTESGKVRETGYVIKYENGNTIWKSNYKLAQRYASVVNPSGVPINIISNYDPNS